MTKLIITKAAAMLLLAACARGQYAFQPDTVRVAPGVSVEKIKARTVILQAGTGNVAQADDYTKSGQRAQAAAVGPAASATAQRKKQGSPWLLYLLLVVAGAAGWEYLSAKSPAKWLPWRVRPG